MLAAGCSVDEIAERLAGAKVEYQRQCLFGSDRRRESTPLFDILRRNHPALADLITHLCSLYGARGLAILLMQREGKLFVDGRIPQLASDGVMALGTHDGLTVQTARAGQTKAKLERGAIRQLGFIPGVSIK